MRFVEGTTSSDTSARTYLSLSGDKEQVYASNMLVEKGKHSEALDILCGKYRNRFMDSDGHIFIVVKVLKEIYLTAFPEHGGVPINSNRKKVGYRKWTP